MFGANPKRPPLKNHDGLSLDVVDIFPTIQGEGPFAGRPAIFIRLGGCNLACDFCDTEFEEFEPMALEGVVEKVINFSMDTRSAVSRPRECLTGGEPNNNWSPSRATVSETGDKQKFLIVITGGEPMRQNITPLCEVLLQQGFEVQIETNGTLYQALPDNVNIVCSPKNTGNGYGPIRPDLLAKIDALKFIISPNHDGYQHVAEWCDGAANTNLPPIYVQPLDEQDEQKNQANTQYTMELAKRCGYRLSLQLHKILQIP